MTSNFVNNFSLPNGSVKSKSIIRLPKNIGKNLKVHQTAIKPRYSKKGTMFRERDLIGNFHDYSLMSPAKARDIHSFSGKNILQESSKLIAKSLVIDRRISDDKSTKVGTEERETSLLLDYFKNKPLIDKMQKYSVSKQTNNHKSTDKLDLPYLNANTKQFNIDDNPKYKRDVVKIESLNMSIDANKGATLPNENIKQLTSKIRDKLSSMRTAEFHSSKTNQYQPHLESAAGKKTLAVSGSVDPNLFKKHISFDCPSSSHREGSHSKVNLTEVPRSNIDDSSYSLNAIKRQSIQTINNVQKNVSKLHNHSHANWSISDVPIKFLTKPSNNNGKGGSTMSTYKNKFESFGTNQPRYQDFISGTADIQQPSELSRKIQSIYIKKKGGFSIQKKNRGMVQSALSSFSKSASTMQGDDIQQANADQKMQYYLNMEKGTRPTDVVSAAK